MFALAALGAIFTGWRLSEGAVRVSFLTPYLQDSVLALPDGWSLAIGETYLDWDGRSGIMVIRTEDVGFINAASQKVLSVPSASFSIHGDALMAGKVEPKDLSTSGMRLVLTRGNDEEWRLGTGVIDEDIPDDNKGADRSVSELTADLFGTNGRESDSSGMLGRLDRFALLDSTVTVVDQPNNRIYQIDARELTLQGSIAGISVKADADVSTRDLTVPLSGSLIYRPDAQEVAGNVRFEPVQVTNVVAALDGPGALSGIDFPISGTVGFRVSIETGLNPLRVELEGGTGVFGLPGVLQDPLPVKQVKLTGVFDHSELALDIETLEYDGGDFKAAAEGRFQMTETGPAVALAISSERVPLLRVPAYWPVGRGVAVRDWLVRNIVGGTGLNVRARMNLTPDMWGLAEPPEEAFDVSFEFQGADVRLPEPFDRITEASGSLTVTGRDLAMSVLDARLGPLQVSEGEVGVADFNAGPAMLDATFRSSGTVSETIDAVLRGRIAQRVGDMTDLSSIEGQADVTTTVSVPLLADARLADAVFQADATLSDVMAVDQFGPLPVRARELALGIDIDGISLEGGAIFGSSEISLRLIERFSASAPISREIAFAGNVKFEDLKAAGLEALDEVSGTSDVEGVVFFSRSGATSGQVQADLEGIAIDPLDIPWSKELGTKGTLQSAFAAESDGALSLNGLKIQTDGLHLQGDVRFSAESRLLDVRLERLDIAGSELSIIARQSPNEAKWSVEVSGRRLDMRPWLAIDESQPDQRGALRDAAVRLAIEEVVTSDAVLINRFSGNLIMAEPFPTGDFTGLINGQAEVAGTANRDLSGWRFTLTSADGGSVLNSLGLGNAIKKGRMSVHGVSSDNETLSGLATIEDFTLTETPAFARLISLASFTGIGEALSGRGLSFSRAEVPFEYSDNRLDIRKGRMAGPSVGLTAEGYYQFDTDQLRFVGNLIPAYSISQVLGKIPLLGAILGGDQGLFGVTYVVEGPSASPEVSVNPLSALAPGILRRMFLQPVDEQEIETPKIEEVQIER